MSGVKTVKLAYIKVSPRGEPGQNLPPVILHHGLTRSKERWKNLMQPLADQTKREVYAVDARNHGDSENSDHFNVEIMAEDLDNFLKTMNISSAAFVGHSMGGAIVMKLALSKPDRVAALVVEDMNPTRLEPEMCHILAAILMEQDKCIKTLSSSSDTKDSVQQKLRECIYRTVPMIPDSDYEVLERTNFPICETEDGGFKLKVNVEAVRGSLLDGSFVSEPYSGKFDKPALFIYGQTSPMRVPDFKEMILELFPKATMYGAPETAHEVYTSIPEEYERQLVAFLGKPE